MDLRQFGGSQVLQTPKKAQAFEMTRKQRTWENMNFHSEPLNLLTLSLSLHVENVCCAIMTDLAAFQQVGRWSYASNLIRASETCGLLPDLTAGGWVGLGRAGALISIRWMKMSVGFGLWIRSSIVLASCVSCAFICVDFWLLPTSDRICQTFHLFSLTALVVKLTPPSQSAAFHREVLNILLSTVPSSQWSKLCHLFDRSRSKPLGFSN